MKKKNKVKDYCKLLKELWAIPRYRALIKLCLYGIMFLMIIVMANLYQMPTQKQEENKEQTKTYTEIINSIDLDNCDIVYNITSPNFIYKIEGKIKDNILSGYIESNDTIKKITLKDNNFYQIINNIEYIDEELNLNLEKSIMMPKNIVGLVSNESAYINKGIEDTTYLFNINFNNQNYEIKLILNLETITNIYVTNNEIEYNIEVDFDNLA